MTMKELDLTGLKCPLPALKTRKALRGMGSGERLVVRCTDPLASIDIPNLVNETGDRLETTERDGDHTIFVIEKAQTVPV
ncbi:MAG: sulfurtransferase TusA family protein [Pseudomonadota bacterium]|nr:sulfurtransferase TusA family protein [Pseudomonadota bacterium]